METLNSMKADPRIQRMAAFPQHGSCNTYQHSINVAMAAFHLARRFHVPVKEMDLARGAMLHDFYLYNIAESGKSAYQHGTGHAKVALHNAEAEYDLTDTEKDIIYSHMWPLNLTHIPHCRESFIITLVDKYAATKERCRQIKYLLKAMIPQRNAA